MARFFRLVKNEYIKVFKKLSTKIMIVLIIICALGLSVIALFAKHNINSNNYKNYHATNDYQKTILIFSIINFIASFAATAVAHIADSGNYNHLSIGQFSYLSLIFVAGVVEFFIAKSTIFQRFSCSKADKTERAAVFAAICAPYYIFIVSSPIVPYIIAVSLYPC